MERLYSVKDAAQALGISPATVYTWLSLGRIVRTKIGSRVLIRQSELERLISASNGPDPRRNGKVASRRRKQAPNADQD
jgi:excisionase family DNA binding protein